MRKFYTTFILCCIAIISTYAATPILGTQQATVERMYQFVKSKNSAFDREIAEQFYAVGQVYGIRGDIAICQSIIETGWFKFSDGTAVTPDQHNYAGLGVTSLGVKGESFATIKDGVTAQIQHLYAYACTKSLPSGETLIDNRFKYVTRGCAPNWEDLSSRWSSQKDYGEKIVEKYQEMMAFSVTEETPSTPPSTSSSSITASSMNISLTGANGGAAPSKTITITGSNLSSDITYNSSSSAFKVTTSNWNSRTGGTMTITLDTSKAVGSYSGYIAVQSGSTRIEIQCTGTITEKAASTTPSITASKTEVNFNSVVKGATAPSQSITITGANLTADMGYNSASSAFKVTTSNWNSRTGGTMTITLDTSKAAGEYNSYIAIQSGSTRIEITCKATITAPETVPALAFTEGWNLSETKGLSDANQWITSVRNFDYANGNLYCIYNNSEIRVVEARSGVYYKNLQVPSDIITSAESSYKLCDIKCIDGGIIACNLTYASTGGELRFYQWTNDNATPTLLYSTQVSERAGDCLGVSGSLNGTLNLVIGNSSGVITVYTRTNGTWSKKTINTGLSTGSSTRVIPVSGGYHIDGRGILPTMVDTSGNVLYTLTSAETVKDGNAFDTFSYDGKKYLMTATYLSNTTTTLDEGAMRLYDVTNGWASGTAIGAYPANGLGSTRNTNCAGSVRTNAGTNYAEAWVLTLGQGLAYYKSGNTPTSGIEPSLQNEAAEIHINSGSVSVIDGNATSISLVSMTGAIVATCNDNALDISNAESGIYIAIATLDNGKTISKKIAIR